MASIAELLARAAALRDETALNSISPERAGGIMYDTLVAMNELWLQQGAALVISKIYASVEAMEADTAPVSDLTGQALRPGQIVVIASSDEDNGSVYRYNGDSSPAWSLVGDIGSAPVVDSLDSESTTLALAARQGKVLDGKIGQLGEYSYDENWVKVVIDANNKVLYGVKKDGSFHVGSRNLSEALETLLLEQSEEWLAATVDRTGKIIEGVTPRGEKFIGEFAPETKKGIINLNDGRYYIEQLGQNFETPLKYKIYNGGVEDNSIKGLPGAKYIFSLPVSDVAYNIRFKFRLTDGLINNPGSFKIADWNGLSVIASSRGLSQATKNYTVSDEQKTSYLPYFLGGISLNDTSLDGVRFNKNIGRFAFAIQYKGESSDVSILNTGDTFYVNVEETSYSFPYSEYDTLDKLYAALSELEGFSMQCNSIEGIQSAELAKFSETKLVSNLFGNTDGQTGNEHEYSDAPIIYIPLARDDSWHQVEIVHTDNITALSVDGKTTFTDVCQGGTLMLGGDCGVLFRDLDIHTNSPSDAELVDNQILSSANPSVIILEGHGMENVPTKDMPAASLSTSVDRLSCIFSLALAKGYVPVSIREIGDYYAGNKELPKRCFTIIFDDYEYENCLNVNYRRVFTKYGVRANLAIITGSDETIYLNGEPITKEQAATICDKYGFQLLSHTRNHRRCTAIVPSQMQTEFEADLYSADIAYATGTFLVYPYGDDDNYVNNVVSWLGYRLGIGVDSGVASRRNLRGTNPYHLVRKDVGIRTSLTYILNSFI